MKKIIFVVMMLVSGVAFGRNCENTDQIAQVVMSARQNGVAMADMIAAADKSSDKKEAIFFKTLIIMAYDRPGYSVSDNQQKAIVDFRNDIYSMCVKGQLK